MTGAMGPIKTIVYAFLLSGFWCNGHHRDGAHPVGSPGDRVFKEPPQASLSRLIAWFSDILTVNSTLFSIFTELCANCVIFCTILALNA